MDDFLDFVEAIAVEAVSRTCHCISRLSNIMEFLYLRDQPVLERDQTGSAGGLSGLAAILGLSLHACALKIYK